MVQFVLTGNGLIVPLCDLTERVAISAFTDLSLTRELCGLMGKTIDVSTMDGAYTMDDEMNSTDFIVETYEFRQRNNAQFKSNL